MGEGLSGEIGVTAACERSASCFALAPAVDSSQGSSPRAARSALSASLAAAICSNNAARTFNNSVGGMASNSRMARAALRGTEPLIVYVGSIRLGEGGEGGCWDDACGRLDRLNALAIASTGWVVLFSRESGDNGMCV